jgi:hypothetical protein
MDGVALERQACDVHEMQEVVSDHERAQGRLLRDHGYFVKQSPVSQTVFAPAIVRRGIF